MPVVNFSRKQAPKSKKQIPEMPNLTKEVSAAHIENVSPGRAVPVRWQQWHCFGLNGGQGSSHTGLLVKALTCDVGNLCSSAFFYVGSNPHHLPCDLKELDFL